MQYDRQADGTLADLPMKVIDTGAGLERNLVLLQDVNNVFETDELARLVDAAAHATGRRYGADADADVALRILADHGRTMTFLVNDGVYPSNEDRGYVLRRIIRRAVRQAYQLGVERLVTPALVAATVEVMGDAYPELLRNADFITDVVAREEERFRQTLKSGSGLLEQEMAGGATDDLGRRRLPAARHLRLPDRAHARDRGRAQRRGRRGRASTRRWPSSARGRATRARRAATVRSTSTPTASWSTSSAPPSSPATRSTRPRRTCVAVLAGGRRHRSRSSSTARRSTPRAAARWATPAPSPPTGHGRGCSTPPTPCPGLHRHLAEVEGEINVGQEATAAIDVERRDAIRRNHTGTHLLHWALREVLGDHVKQQGSLVAPDYLRFDFSHYGPVTPEELERVEDLVNAEVLANEPVRAYETTKADAEQLGAIAFFGDKYGDYVRVVEAGDRSVELCGGTHVGALGMIGPIKVTTEQSIGANLRRIFALTGTGTLERVREEERLLARTAELLKAQPDEVPEAVERVLEKQRALADENKALRAQSARGDAGRLVADAVDGKVVARVDDVQPNDLRDLAVAVRDQPGVDAVVLIGSPDGERVALVAATKDSGVAVNEIVAAARKVGRRRGRQQPDHGRGRRQGRGRHRRRPRPGPRRSSALR